MLLEGLRIPNASTVVAWKASRGACLIDAAVQLSAGLASASRAMSGRSLPTRRLGLAVAPAMKKKPRRTPRSCSEDRAHRCRILKRRSRCSSSISTGTSSRTLAVGCATFTRLYPGAIGELEVSVFLKALSAATSTQHLIGWDRLPAHRSRLRERAASSRAGPRITSATEYLPPSPELNPVEYKIVSARVAQSSAARITTRNSTERARSLSSGEMRRKPRLD